MATGLPTNHALSGRIALASSVDPRFPPENVIDGSAKTFWMTTGMFPQSIVVSLPYAVHVKKLTLTSTRVASIQISLYSASLLNLNPSVDESAKSFSQDLEDVERPVFGQTATFSIPSAPTQPTRHIKITIRKGHATFAAVSRVAVMGDRADEPAASALDDSAIKRTSAENSPGTIVTVGGVPLRKESSQESHGDDKPGSKGGISP
ncbi:uncharacterized protein BJ171DRAFT_280092 [Polychytrium aggregatum]|uniref:uncharacterized protein n=1 Tax=Polychytrium aggregatum TaxID=110093 RepID=UPI0022FE3D8F|nr:uncharacterized protein BJ171DRAFT_280092 [Polychytrium aggregatum]KAI9207701.1 hypothetical protein BJ171DRAFT_280092 [Polychytrium aggregatum]